MSFFENEEIYDKWRGFVRDYASFCLKIALKIPKTYKKIIFFRVPVKYTINDFPTNVCLREDAYEKLRNLTESEFEGVLPVELMTCIEMMMTARAPRDFEVWLNENYNDWHTPKKFF